MAAPQGSSGAEEGKKSAVSEGKRKALSGEEKESKLKSILGKGLFKRK